jgi:DNA-directed RNA polymerase specialized sigma subunit
VINVQEKISKIVEHIKKKFGKDVSHEEIMKKIKPKNPIEGLRISRAIGVIYCKENGMSDEEIAEKFGGSVHRIRRIYKYGIKRFAE